MDGPNRAPPILEKRDDSLGVIARYAGGVTVWLVDRAGRVLRRTPVGEVPTSAEVKEAMDYLLAMAWARSQVRRMSLHVD
jgi:hypothetical protein